MGYRGEGLLGLGLYPFLFFPYFVPLIVRLINVNKPIIRVLMLLFDGNSPSASEICAISAHLPGPRALCFILGSCSAYFPLFFYHTICVLCGFRIMQGDYVFSAFLFATFNICFVCVSKQKYKWKKNASCWLQVRISPRFSVICICFKLID